MTNVRIFRSIYSQLTFFIEALLATARVYNNIDDLLKRYSLGQSKKRASELSEMLSVLYKKRDESRDDIMTAMTVKVDPASYFEKILSLKKIF